MVRRRYSRIIAFFLITILFVSGWEQQDRYLFAENTPIMQVDITTNEYKVQAGVYNVKVEVFQCYLAELGLLASENVDGYWGKISEEAMQSFQQTHGLTITAYPNQATLTALYSAFNPQQYLSTPAQGVLNLNYFGFFYGDLSNIDNKHSLVHSIQELSRLPYVVCSPPFQLSLQSIIVADTIKTSTNIFGYVNLGPNNPYESRDKWIKSDINEIKTQIDTVAANGWYGVFIDQFGYDFGETRQRQNVIVNYAHSKGLKCFVNAWFVAEALGGSTYLTEGDWYLCESFLRTNSEYRSGTSSIQKYIDAMNYANVTGVRIAGLSYNSADTPLDQATSDINMSNILAKTLGLNGWWYSDDTIERQLLVYGKEPSINIGSKILSYLQHIAGNKYVAVTDKYRIEFYAGENPSMVLYPLTAKDSYIYIGGSQPRDYVNLDNLTKGEQILLLRRLNAYGYRGNRLDTALNNFLQNNNIHYFSIIAFNEILENNAVNINGTKGSLQPYLKPEVVVRAGSADEKMLYSQYRNKITYILSEMNQYSEIDIETTNARYQEYLAKLGVKPIGKFWHFVYWCIDKVTGK